MNILYEDNGTFRVGAVLAEHDASLQVEAPHGKRSKVKSANVLLRFGAPGLADFLERRRAGGGGDRRRFPVGGVRRGGVRVRRARRRVPRPRADPGRGGEHPAETALGAGLLPPEGQGALQGRPGRDAEGRARGAGAQAPAERADRRVGRGARAVRDARGARARSCRSSCTSPTGTASRPRRSSRRANQLGLSPARLAERCGALGSSHDYHLGRFLFEHFPRGAGFPELPAPELPADLLTRKRGGVQPRRRDDHRDRRRVLGQRAAPTARCASACTSPRRRSASRPARRSTRSPASGCRPPTCPATRSRCCRHR